jgi:hypothetical protein
MHITRIWKLSYADVHLRNNHYIAPEVPDLHKRAAMSRTTLAYFPHSHPAMHLPSFFLQANQPPIPARPPTGLFLSLLLPNGTDLTLFYSTETLQPPLPTLLPLFMQLTLVYGIVEQGASKFATAVLKGIIMRHELVQEDQLFTKKYNSSGVFKKIYRRPCSRNALFLLLLRSALGENEKAAFSLTVYACCVVVRG